MLKVLRPAYERYVPSRKTLTNALINDVYNECVETASNYVPKHSVLLVDGWKNSANNSKLVVSIIHNTTSFSQSTGSFVHAVDCSGESETAEKVSSIVEESIDVAKNLYKTEIYAVVTDNASTMLCMGKHLQEVVWHNTCNSHTANLLAKDVTNKTVVEDVNRILKEFKNCDLEKAVVDLGGKRMKLACETRWCSNRDACRCLLSNLQHMKQIIIDEKPKKVKNHIAKLVFDEEFIDVVKYEIQLFDPICQIINTCQKKETSIADAASLWLKLGLLEHPRNIQEKVHKRIKKALTTYALAAYYLHPYYDNTLLSELQIEKVNEFLLKTLNDEGLEDLCHLKVQSGIFGTLYDKKIKKWEVFWKTAEMRHKNLADVAQKLLNIPASSAQIERLFSNWGNVHTDLRNPLSLEHSKKLTHIYFSINSNTSCTENEDDDDNDDDYY